MNEILINAMTILVLLAGLAALVAWVRHDAYAAPGLRHRRTDRDSLPTATATA